MLNRLVGRFKDWERPRLSAMEADGPFGPRAYAAMFARQTVLNLIIGALAGIGCIIVTWRLVPWRLELVWGVFFAALLALQSVRRYRVRNKEITEDRARRMLSNAVPQSFLAGLTWGLTGFAIPYLPAPNQVAVSLVALSLAVAATVTLSSAPRAAAAFTIPVVLSYIFVFATRATGPYIVLALLGLAFLLVILFGMAINAASLRSELVARSEAVSAQAALAAAQELWSEFSRSAEAFALFDEEGALLLWNEAYRQLIGAGTLTRGQHWRDMETESSYALPEDTVLRRVGPVPSTFSQTFALGGRWYQTSIEPLSNGHIAINHVDITALKANEQQLLALQADLMAARDKAEAANTAKSEFLAKMSHELRTPLNAVIGFADLIGQDHDRGREDPVRHSGYAKVISDSGQHLLAIVDDLLDLARIEAGKIKVKESEFDLGELMRSARMLVAARPREKPIAFVEDLPKQPLLFRGDQRLLRQAMINLIENAAKFCEGEPEIHLRLSRTRDGGVDILVEDNGIGISNDMLQTVQDPFVQAEQTEARKYGGVGLGLALVRQFVELHDGKLNLKNRDEGGMVATISLPRQRVSYP